jgi:hypothetical protein
MWQTFPHAPCFYRPSSRPRKSTERLQSLPDACVIVRIDELSAIQYKLQKRNYKDASSSSTLTIILGDNMSLCSSIVRIGFPLLVIALCGGTSALGQNLEKIKATAEAAYIFAYPMLQNYQTMYEGAIDTSSPTYKGPFNVLVNNTNLFGPEYTTVVRPNNDTVYSSAALDLRAEPVVMTVPAIPNRYYAFQLVDLYTYNFAYIGTRATGTNAGRYLIAGPYWKGEIPPGIDAVFRSEGNFVCIVGRTEVDGEADLPNVLALQQGYVLQTLSEYLGQPAPAVRHKAIRDEFPAYDAGRAQTADFITYFNFLLGQLDIYPTEKTLIASFRSIGIGPGRPFDTNSIHADVRGAIEAGIASGWYQITNEAYHLGVQSNCWNLTPSVFGSREQMETNYPDAQTRYLVRAGAAYGGLYGNDLEEAYYPSTVVDAATNILNGASNNYVLKFLPEQLPRVNAFWSITMYDTNQLMVSNVISRYSIGDRTSGLVTNNGTLEIYLQRDTPAPDKTSNWLPAPDGPFSLTLRMYLPQPQALNPLYAPPAVSKQE